jgi:hypothetical protein
LSPFQQINLTFAPAVSLRLVTPEFSVVACCGAGERDFSGFKKLRYGSQKAAIVVSVVLDKQKSYPRCPENLWSTLIVPWI